MNEREGLLRLVGGAVAALERSRERIDDLNVYPVPDGDTGTNLALTARAVLEALEASTAEDRATLARETTRAALMGARGNSGVILSQIVRGLAESLAGEGRAGIESVDGPAVARALRAGAVAAYRAVRKPVEGTMLTAISALADAAEAEPAKAVAPPVALEAQFERLGDSLLVVGDEHALKVHVHTDDPGTALAIGTRAGAIENVEIADMHRQTKARERRLLAAVPDPLPAAVEVVAVVTGSGNRRLFESLGATQIVEGGQTMNPSAAELVAAVDATDAPEAIVLPNNANIRLAAEQAASLAKRPTRVVATTSMQAGLSALVAFNPVRPAEENATPMAEAAARVATGAVTMASRDVQLNGRAVGAGEYIGLLEDEPVTGGSEFEPVARALLERLLAEPREVV